jgi:hypothetical protein
MRDRNPERSALGDVFDRTLRGLNGLPDVCATKATTLRNFTLVKEEAQTFIVQTLRKSDLANDTDKRDKSQDYVSPDAPGHVDFVCEYWNGRCLHHRMLGEGAKGSDLHSVGGTT